MTDEKRQETNKEAPAVSRRDLFQHSRLGAGWPLSAGSALAQQHEGHNHGGEQGAATAKGPYKRQTFDDHQWKTVHVLC